MTKITNELSNLVVMKNDKAVTTSLIVAKHFQKRPKDVNRAIENLPEDEFNRRNFAPISYVDEKGRTQPMYEISRDGFAILGMGFTGKIAYQFKIDFIKAFNLVKLRQLKQAASKDMLANANIKSFWLLPSQHSAGKDNLRRSMISVRGITTFAGMLAFAQRLFDDDATSRAGLRGVPRAYFYVLNTGVFRLVLQDRQELVPTSVQHRTSEPVILDHPLDVQAFHSEPAVTVNKTNSYFVMRVLARIRNRAMQAGNRPALFSSTIRASYFPAQAALLYAQLFKIGFERLQGRLMFGVARGDEALKPDIETNVRPSAGHQRDIRQFASDGDKPLVDFALDVDRFNLALDLPVQVDSHETNMLQAQLVSDNAGAVANRRVRETIEPVLAFEPWVSRLFFTSFDAAKKRLKRLIQVTHRGLSATEIETCEPRIDGTLFFVPSALFSVFDRSLFSLKGGLALCKASVVKAAMRLKGDVKLARLVDVRFKPEFVGAKHLASLLVFDVGTHRLLRYMSYRPGVIRTAPERRKARTQRRELIAQRAGSRAFHAVDNLGNAPTRVKLNKEMYMIRHYLKRMHSHFKLFCFFVEERDKPRGNRSNQHRATILRAPHDMQLKTENRAGVFSVSVHAHHYTCSRYIMQHLIWRTAIPLPAKAGSPLAA